MATLVVKSQEMSDNLTIPGVMSNLRRNHTSKSLNHFQANLEGRYYEWNSKP